MIPVPPEVLQQLAAAYGTRPADLTHHGGGRGHSDGIVYAYPYAGGRRLLKIMAIPAAEEKLGLFCLDERLRLGAYLGQRALALAGPRPSPQGRLYETWGGAEHLWVSYAMELAPGRIMPGNAWEPTFFRAWGQAIGRWHRLVQDYPTWQTSTVHASGAETLTWREEWSGFYNWCRDSQIQRQWERVRDRLETLAQTRQAMGFCHNDPHIQNVLWDGQQLTLIDLDVANHHWFASDIAIACQSVLFSHSGGMERPLSDRDRLRNFLDLFLQGYAQENTLASEWLERLDLFLAYRRILLYTAMQDWLETQPDARDSWKRMILEEPGLLG